MTAEKHFYSICYYWETKDPKFYETDRFYGTLEDMEFMINKLIQASPKRIRYVEINGLDVRYCRYINVPKTVERVWND